MFEIMLTVRAYVRAIAGIPEALSGMQTSVLGMFARAFVERLGVSYLQNWFPLATVPDAIESCKTGFFGSISCKSISLPSFVPEPSKIANMVSMGISLGKVMPVLVSAVSSYLVF